MNDDDRWRVDTALSGNRIVTVPSPRVARQDTLYRQIASFKNAVFPERFQPVLGAGGRIAAFGAEQRRDQPLIYFNQEDKRVT